MAKKVIKIATRQSILAQVQARAVGDAIVKKHPDYEYELHFITTTGDKFMGDLSKVGGKVAFVKEVDEALLNGEAHIAAHSMKDVPTDMPEGLVIRAMLPRADIRDAIVCREGEDFANLKEGAIVGTSSVRRAAQLRYAFPHLEVKPVRGNVQTRLDKLRKREYDALVLAKAGLDRLDLEKRISDVLEPDMMCPAVSQGAIGVECRADDAEMVKIVESINDEPTWHCVNTERAYLDHLGGSCHTPIAGFVEITKGGNLRLIGLVASEDGKQILRTRHKMGYDEWEKLARTAADDLFDQGAEAIIAATHRD